MSVKLLLKRVERLKEKHFVEPAGIVTQSEEWLEEISFVLGFLEHRYPDAYLVVAAEVKQIETEDRAREQQPRRRVAGKVPWLETREGLLHSYSCRLATYGVLGPYLDARIALAEEIDRLENE